VKEKKKSEKGKINNITENNLKIEEQKIIQSIKKHEKKKSKKNWYELREMRKIRQLKQSQ
jgi:hypothetical protein